MFGNSSSSLVPRSGNVFNEPQHVCYLSDVKGDPPFPAGGHSADVIGSNQMYVFGGFDGRTEMNDVYILNTDKMEWRHLSLSGAPSGRANVRGSLNSSKLYLVEIKSLYIFKYVQCVCVQLM